MAKTYNPLSNVTVGSVLTASDYNEAIENSNNFRVPPMCILRKTGTQACNNGSFTPITFGAGEELYDTDEMHSTSSNTARITPTTAGIYLFTGNVYLSAFPATGMAIRGLKNGSQQIFYSENSSATIGITGSAMEYMNGTTDFVTLEVFYSHSGNLTTNASVFPGFQAAFIGQPS